MDGTLAALEHRIQRLEDAEAIKRLIAGWARAGDSRNDPARMAATLARDAECEIEGFGHYRGRERIAAELRRIAEEQIDWTIHFMTTPVIDISEDGKQASVFWYLWEAAKTRSSPEERPRPTWIAGWYENEAIKEDGQWVFQKVKLVLKLFTSISEGDWEILAPGRIPPGAES